MIRIGLILAIVTITLIVWAYGYTEKVQGNGLDRDAGKRWCSQPSVWLKWDMLLLSVPTLA